MSRPRKDSEQPDLRPVLLDAFWKLLESKRLDQISVREIAAKAQCNRATFYYHFKDMDDLVYRALEHELVDDPTLVRCICSIIVGEPQFDFLCLVTDPHFARIRLMFVSGGLERTSRIMHRLVVESWTRMLRADEGLSPETTLVLEYAVGGMISIVINCFSSQEDNMVPAEKLAFLTVFLRDNAAHMMHQISRTENMSEQEILNALRGASKQFESINPLQAEQNIPKTPVA